MEENRSSARESLALVIPLFNEEAAIDRLIRELEEFRDRYSWVRQIILVDDGSNDGTVAKVKSLTSGLSGYVLVSFSRNFGHQLAITAGLELVDADAAVVLDADLQDPLSVVPAFVEEWRNGYDVVYGVRRSRDGDSRLQQVTASMFYRVFRRLADVDAPLDAGDFRLIGRPVIGAYKRLSEQQPYVRGLISWLGFNQIGVPYDRAPRTEGTSKYAWRDRLRLALRGLAAFSGKPLRLAVRMGLALSLAAVAGLIWVLVARFILHDTVPGWASIAFIAFFFGGMNLFFLGLVGAYVSRVYDEVKGRPRYIVSNSWRSEQLSGASTQHPNLPSEKA